MLTSANPDDPRAWMIARNLDHCRTRFPRRFADAQATHPDVRAWAQAYQDSPRSASSLLLLGPTGTGKTYEAHGAIRAAVAMPATIRWYATTAPDLVASLRGRSGDQVETELARYEAADLLLVDDLGVGKSSEWTEEVTYRLVNSRYEHCRPTIYTSNVPPAQLSDVLGERVASRLVEQCQRVTLKGADRRRERRAS